MRKIHVLGLGLLAVFVYGAIMASAAFAAPEWLVEESAVTENLPAETEGELELVKLVSSTNSAHLVTVKCSAILVGSIGPAGKDEITSVLTLSEASIGKEVNETTTLEGAGLECTVTQSEGGFTDCALNSVALVWPANLPWKSQLELMESTGTVLDVVTSATGSGPGYDVECKTVSGITGSELCEGPASAFVSNSVGTPMGVEGKTDETEEANCTITGEKTGQLIGTGTTWAVGGTVANPEVLNRLDTLVDHV
jgi:hypothetical protein